MKHKGAQVKLEVYRIQVNKTFSKNVQGCRDGSAKKTQKLGVETGHKNTAKITPSLHLSFLYMTYFFDNALRLLGNYIVHEKRCRDGVICAVFLYPVSTPSFCVFFAVQ